MVSVNNCEKLKWTYLCRKYTPTTISKARDDWRCLGRGGNCISSALTGNAGVQELKFDSAGTNRLVQVTILPLLSCHRGEIPSTVIPQVLSDVTWDAAGVRWHAGCHWLCQRETIYGKESGLAQWLEAYFAGKCLYSLEFVREVGARKVWSHLQLIFYHMPLLQIFYTRVKWHCGHTFTVVTNMYAFCSVLHGQGYMSVRHHVV